MKFAIDSGLKGQILRLLPLTEPWCSSDTSQGGKGGWPPWVRGGCGLSRELGSEEGTVWDPLLGRNFKKIIFPDKCLAWCSPSELHLGNGNSRRKWYLPLGIHKTTECLFNCLQGWEAYCLLERSLSEMSDKSHPPRWIPRDHFPG